MEKITGKNNELIKGVKKLISSSGERKAEGRFVLEGARLVFDVLNSLYQVSCFLVTENAYEKYKAQCDTLIERSDKAYFISEEIAKKLSDTKNPQGIFAVCKISDKEIDIVTNGKYIALDNLQDPGNLGTVIRTAEALGIDGVIVGGGCDIYNPKVLRSSMGSVLRLDIIRCNDITEKLSQLKASGFRIYATTPDSNAVPVTEIDFSKGGICVIGNEANGVSDSVINLAHRCITIPMKGRAESLNASAAASVIMWEMLR